MPTKRVTKKTKAPIHPKPPVTPRQPQVAPRTPPGSTQLDAESALFSTPGSVSASGARFDLTAAREAAGRRRVAGTPEAAEEPSVRRPRSAAWQRLQAMAAQEEALDEAFPSDAVPDDGVGDDESELELEDGASNEPALIDYRATTSDGVHPDIRRALLETSPVQAHESYAHRSALPPASLTEPTIEDIDRLWDWLRQDANPLAFIGLPVTTSVGLHQVAQALVTGEQARVSLLRSIVTPEQTHVGFVALAPIRDGFGVLHVYLAPPVRGLLAELAQVLLPQVLALIPNMRLAVWSADETWSRLHRQVLKPLGFVEHTMFVR